jgi:hypothetical protein
MAFRKVLSDLSPFFRAVSDFSVHRQNGMMLKTLSTKSGHGFNRNVEELHLLFCFLLCSVRKERSVRKIGYKKTVVSYAGFLRDLLFAAVSEKGKEDKIFATSLYKLQYFTS